jgi:hypothetical protein
MLKVQVQAKELNIKVAWDEEAKEWVAIGEGISGLVAQGHTLEALFAKLSGKAARLEALTPEDHAWMGADLSRMAEIEPYDWGPGGEPVGLSVRWNPQQGILEVADEE